MNHLTTVQKHPGGFFQQLDDPDRRQEAAPVTRLASEYRNQDRAQKSDQPSARFDVAAGE